MTLQKPNKSKPVARTLSLILALSPKKRGRAIRAFTLRKAFAKTMLVRYGDIPQHLQAGEFFRSLSSDDPECNIEIPIGCFPGDEEVAEPNLKTFRQLLRVMGFWMLDSIPVGVLDFCETNDVAIWQGVITKHAWARELGILPALLTAYGTPGFVPVKDIILTGRWDIISHCVDRMQKDSSATAAAALTGNVQVVEFFRDEGFAWHVDTCSNCSKFGHLECLKYAHENGCPWDKRVYVYAAEEGHLECIKYAHQQGLEWDVEVCMYAVFYGQLECLQYAHENGCPWDDTTMRAAAESGNVNCMQYAHLHGLGWTADICSAAAFEGQVRSLMYAHQNGCPWDSKTIAVAAQNGRANCLEYALINNCPLFEDACSLAARNGHLECLNLLVQFGVVCDKVTACHAAQCSNAACLQYLYGLGCEWDETTTNRAVMHNSVDCLSFALQHGCPHVDALVEVAAYSGSITCLQYLIEHQGLWMDGEVFKVALLRGNLHMVQYIMDQNCPYLGAIFGGEDFPLSTCKKVFIEGNAEFLECVKLAVERGWVPDTFFIDFVEVNDAVCAAWLKLEGYHASMQFLCIV